MPANSVEQELIGVTKLRKRVAEPFQKWAARLIESVQTLDDEVWETISPASQKWVNAGAQQLSLDTPGPIDAFPEDEMVEDEEPEEEQEAEQEEEEAAPPPRDLGRVRPKPRPQAEEKAKKPEKVAKPRKGADPDRPVGGRDLIKNTLIKDPKITLDQLMDRLEKKGYGHVTRLAAAGIRSDFLHSAKLMREAGVLNLELD